MAYPYRVVLNKTTLTTFGKPYLFNTIADNEVIDYRYQKNKANTHKNHI